VRAVPRVEERWIKVSWVISALAAVAIIVLAMFRYGPLDPGFHQSLNLAFIAAITIPMVLDMLNSRWRSSINKALPRFLEGIAHAQLTGLPLIRAFKEAGEGVAGPLRSEVRLMMAKVSWGMSLEDALKTFAERVGTPLARRISTLIIEANRSGGLVERIFTPLAQATATFQTMEEERKAQLKPYVLVVYISFILFLVIIYVLYTSFFTPLQAMPTVAGGPAPAMPLSLSWVLLYHMSLVLAVFSGLIAGVLGEGRVQGGLKHVFIMLILAYVLFREMVEPMWLLGLLGLA